MKRLPILAAGWVLCLSALIGARQDQGQTPPVFRTGVELIQLDVSVLDSNRRPVRGLAATDFSVLVDGQPRPVVAFKAVELPPPPPLPTARWMRDIPSDVVTNARSSGRVVAILIDDGSFNNPGSADLFAVSKAREVARVAIDELGPEDLAAVLFTEHGRSAQNFISNRQLLLEAIDKAAIVPSPTTNLGERATCACGTCSITAIERLAEVLQSLPQERKTVLYVSAGVAVEASVDVPYNPIGASAAYAHQHCNALKQKAMMGAIQRASLANVTVQAVDVRGVTPSGIDLNIGFLRAMSEDTGGRAVVRTNEMERQVPALFAETRAYYLLGVEAPAVRDDGRMHAIRVEVGRPGLEVRSRRGYYAPSAAERRRGATSGDRGGDAALAGVLPKADLPLDVSVFPFPDARARERSAVGVILGVTLDDGRGVARKEQIQVVATAFHPESGRSVGSHTQTVGITRTATNDALRRYEVPSRLPLRPGRYEIRVAVEANDGRTGSVYTYADVPDFRGEDLALSGLVMSVVPGPRTASSNAFSDVIPVIPTGRRSFSVTDRATAWLRIHRQNDAAGSITVRVRDAADAIVVERADVLAVRPGRGASTIDHQFAVPIERLRTGEYLLTAEVVAGDDTARRDVRFRIE